MNEIEELFFLNVGIIIEFECLVGLIGDDIEVVVKKVSKEFNKLVVLVCCEGFCGVFQLLGYYIVNDIVCDWVYEFFVKVINEEIGFEKIFYDVFLIVDYNIGGDGWSFCLLLDEIGLRVVS